MDKKDRMSNKQLTTWQMPFEFKPTGTLDPLCQKLWGKTESEFLKMFEEPSKPDEK